MFRWLFFVLNPIFIILIFIYQKMISPIKLFLFGPTCRFYPTCSQYALESFVEYPFPIAIYLSLKRILRCHPWNEGGEDPLPHLVKFQFKNQIFTFHSKKQKKIHNNEN